MYYGAVRPRALLYKIHIVSPIWSLSWPLTLDDINGKIKVIEFFNGLYFLNGACSNKSVYETYSKSYSTSVDLMTFEGHKGQLTQRCHALDAMINKLYPSIQKAVNPFRFKNFEHLFGSGWNHNLWPGCRHHLASTFHTPARSLRLDAPAPFPSPQSQ